MYYRYFGLNGPPFEFTTAPAALYLGKEHSEALAALEWSVLREPSGYTLFVGEPGTGKTTLVSAILARHYQRVRAVYLNHPKLSFAEILMRITRQLGIEPQDQSKLAVIEAFNQYLSQLAPEERVVMVFDEAQALSDDGFEELRLLANQGHPERRQLQIILAGQPELARRLQSPALKQLNERIGARAMLHPLSDGEVLEYIAHLVGARGGRPDAIFSGRALKLVVQHSHGIARRVNILCHNAMLSAFSRNATRVSAEVMREVVAEYDDFAGGAPAPLAPPAVRWPVRVRHAALGLASLALLGASGSLWLWHTAEPVDIDLKPAPVQSFAAPLSLAEPPLSPRFVYAAPTSAAPAAPVASGLAAAAGLGSPVVKVAPLPVSHTQSLPTQVRVRSGDTATAIAQRYLGGAGGLAQLAARNPQIHNLDVIYPGEVINLPARGATAEAN
ncbi:MAG TPA: AAA family ATPase [Candidatus Binataceae bacterium]|nr:AAA family ATPase [Candidatus Binataceae bacterium]